MLLSIAVLCQRVVRRDQCELVSLKKIKIDEFQGTDEIRTKVMNYGVELNMFVRGYHMAYGSTVIVL